MKKWIEIFMVSFFLCAIVPMAVFAATNGSGSLTADGEKNQVTVSLDTPEGKTEAITSLRLQLFVSAITGSMEAPEFAFEGAISSMIQDANVSKDENGNYLVDLILSGKKNQDIFASGGSVKLGTLSVKPVGEAYELQVEIVDLAGGSEPMARYVEAAGSSVTELSLANVTPVRIEKKNGSDPGPDPVPGPEPKPDPGPSPGQPQEVVAPGTPSLTATVSKPKIVFTWTNIAGADGYTLYELNPATQKYEEFYSVAAPVAAYTKEYTYASTHSFRIAAYKVKADNSKLYGAQSPVINVTIGPDKVKDFTPEYKNTTKAVLSWKKASGASGYQIYRSTKKSGKYTLLKTIKKGSTKSYTVTHKAGKVYYYKIRAYVNGADGKPVYGSFCTAEQAKVKAPKVKVSVNAASKSVKLSWKKIARANGYNIYRAKKKNGKYKLIKTIKNASELSFTETKASGSSVWYYKVCAYETQKKGKALEGKDTDIVKEK